MTNSAILHFRFPTLIHVHMIRYQRPSYLSYCFAQRNRRNANLSSRNTSSFPSFLPLCMAENQHSFSLSSQHPPTVLSHTLSIHLTTHSSLLSETEFLDEIQTKVLKEFSSLLFTVTPTALSWDFYFFNLNQPPKYFLKFTQPLTYFYSAATVHCKGEGGNPLLYGFRNPYRNLMSENSDTLSSSPFHLLILPAHSPHHACTP